MALSPALGYPSLAEFSSGSVGYFWADGRPRRDPTRKSSLKNRCLGKRLEQHFSKNDIIISLDSNLL